MFNYLEKMKYDLMLDGKPKKVTNIFQNAHIIEQYRENPLSHYEYTVRDEDTPETIAHLYYGSHTYGWVILWMNDIANVYDNWPMTSRTLQTHIETVYGAPAYAGSNFYPRIFKTGDYIYDTLEQKVFVRRNARWEIVLNDYSASNLNGLSIARNIPIHYTHDVLGHKISPDTYNLLTPQDKKKYTIYNAYDYEHDKNEKNRVIKLLRANLLNDFLLNFEEVI